jgi:hypothetical protein
MFQAMVSLTARHLKTLGIGQLRYAALRNWRMALDVAKYIFLRFTYLCSPFRKGSLSSAARSDATLPAESALQEKDGQPAH